MALSTVGPYRVLERLGAGANGEVYLAEDTRLHRRVALKTLSGTAASDGSELRRRLLREARAAARLNHPRIAAVYDVLESDEGVHIVMEYVRGTTLAARIRQGPPTPMQAIDTALQLSDALAHAHALGVVHRDLKPANIVMGADGSTKILDFGLARLSVVDVGSTPLSGSDESVEVLRVVGTPPYIPPEHLAGAPVDAKGDIYSLGVTLFELLAGRRPFEASNNMGLSQAILSAPTPRLRDACPDCPAGLDAIVYRAMSRNPNDRYATAAEMASDLKRLSAEITSQPTESREWRRAPAVGTRRLGWTAAAIVAGGLAAYAMVGPLRFGGATPLSAASLANGPKVVAVLPLVGGAGDPQNEDLAAGFADTLITTLSKVPGLTVVSRASTVKYRDRKMDPDAIARELGVTMLVDGSLQRTGDHLRVTLAVLQPGVKTALWQDTSDGRLADMFELQTQVADAVAAKLRLPDAPSTAERPTNNVEAFGDYAQARRFLEQPDVKGRLEDSIVAFQRAISRDSRFARAYAGLGEAYWRKYQATRDEKWSIEARDAINEALRLDPADSSVRLSLASIYRGRGLSDKAVDELQKVILAAPQSDEAHRQLGTILVTKDRDRGIAELKEAIRLRPDYWVNHGSLGSAYFGLGEYKDAAQSFRRITELQPESSWGYSMLGSALHAMDDTKGAATQYKEAIKRGSATASTNLGSIDYTEGRYDAAAANFLEAIKRDPNAPLLHLNLADAYTQLTRAAEAQAEYRRALELNQAQVKVNPADTMAVARMAVIESKLGRAKDASIHIAEALARDANSADIAYYAAVIHVRAGRFEDATKSLGDAFRRGYSQKRASRDPDLRPLQGHAGYRTLMARNAEGDAR